MENNKNKKSVKFQGDMSIFYDFIQVFVFTTNHHLNLQRFFFQITHAVNDMQSTSMMVRIRIRAVISVGIMSS